MKFLNVIPIVFYFPLLISAIPAQSHTLQSRNTNPTVTISPGVIIGTTTTYPDATGAANKFMGIPFASSPPLRFGPPHPPQSWTQPLQAVTSKPACIQQGSYPFPIPEESEDCLYLNVFTPFGTKPESKIAVMFWIYGGNLQAGSSTASLYDGSFLAGNNDIIVVTINYRMNIFGFSNSPAIPTDEQNVGFMDQRLALQWVQENIAQFGGDPAQVTIFGQSAGGLSVENLIALPPSPLPFRAAIIESPGLLLDNNGPLNFASLARALNCPRNSNADGQLQCVRSANPIDIQRLIGKNSFRPISDGLTFTDDISTPIKSGTAAQIPLIIGNTLNDGSIVAYNLGLETDPVSPLLAALETIFPAFSTIYALLNTTLTGNLAYNLVSALATNLLMQCPVAELSLFAHSHGYPVWRFIYNASFPNSEQFPNSGAFHASEIPEVFGTYIRENATTQQVRLSQYMSGTWANFAKKPLAGPGWPQIGGLWNLVGDLGGGGSDGEMDIRADEIDQLCPLLDTIKGVEGLLNGL